MPSKTGRSCRPQIWPLKNSDTALSIRSFLLVIFWVWNFQMEPETGSQKLKRNLELKPHPEVSCALHKCSLLLAVPRTSGTNLFRNRYSATWDMPPWPSGASHSLVLALPWCRKPWSNLWYHWHKQDRWAEGINAWAWCAQTPAAKVKLQTVWDPGWEYYFAKADPKPQVHLENSVSRNGLTLRLLGQKNATSKGNKLVAAASIRISREETMPWATNKCGDIWCFPKSVVTFAHVSDPGQRCEPRFEQFRVRKGRFAGALVDFIKTIKRTQSKRSTWTWSVMKLETIKLHFL